VEWLLAILAGVLAAPVGFVLGTLVAYGALTLRGMTEREGRRGLLAGTFGGPLGAIGGFMLGFQGYWWLEGGGGGGLAGLLGGCLFGIPLGLLVGAAGLVCGIRLAERRKVTNYMGERAAWGFYYVALPSGVLTACGGFLLGWWMLGGAR
jgi:hypothetical protein